MSVWDELRAKQKQFDSDLLNAQETAKQHGFVDVKCHEAGLLWSAKASKLEKFDKLKRPSLLGPFKTADQLIDAMKRSALPTFGGGAMGITADHDAKARAFLAQKKAD